MGNGEFELIARLVQRMPQPGPRVRIPSGDDAAVTEYRGPVVITVDALIEGVHFTLPEYPLEAVGRKALAAALSDLAAMGAEPGEAYVVIGLPRGLEGEEVMALGDGLAEVAAREGISVVGGDVNRSPALLLSVTAVGGEPEDSPLVRRAGAAPGDIVVVTGELGGAAAALRLLGVGAPAGSPPDERLRDALLSRQFDPLPRLAAGRGLAGAGATAMIDLSDGLAADAAQVAAAGSVRLELELERLPLAPGLEVVAGGFEEAMLLAAAGGEDYELLACLPPDRLAAARAAVEAAGCPLAPIGRVAEGEGVALLDASGREVEVSGFDHLRRGYQ